MPTKKKKGGKKKGSKATVVLTTFDYIAPGAAELGIQDIGYISLSIKMCEMVHLSFEWEVVPTVVTIAGIKDSIRARHGGTVTGVILYKDMISQNNMLPDEDSMSLQDIGIEGGPYMGDPGALPHITLFYDFPTQELDCPILNDTPYEAVPRYMPVPDAKHESARRREERKKDAVAGGTPGSRGTPATPSTTKGGGIGSLLSKMNATPEEP
mmetsp:Transcript_30594/g.66759  ORF Transcript_30594/g.66759 Transcript_30594/m.66759 type:complete len:211 (-) Transcript_30594:293-925(-)|eukprot:CAMPEP_0118930284 /NCGR_PEP_ID=MMETSP1169-20130426/7023_1 /TAXON_ID=36882 /ORGANISM="Pyramimonas obovata, Strain CCMP722" /LENGTH=210 /DNA_ID=CAMNT_0006872611 /DNA_START=343 /DNA_END=975 /DNA_ORIENTATION=+